MRLHVFAYAAASRTALSRSACSLAGLQEGWTVALPERPAASAMARRGGGPHVDGVWDEQLLFGLVLQRVAGDGLERLFHVDVLLGAGVKVRDAALGAAPLHAHPGRARAQSEARCGECAQRPCRGLRDGRASVAPATSPAELRTQPIHPCCPRRPPPPRPPRTCLAFFSETCRAVPPSTSTLLPSTTKGKESGSAGLACSHACACVYVYICICTNMQMCVCLCLNIYICMFV